ncbi:MAG TPA: hypothetical protein VFB13_04100 [Reyranella sp.]|jgi:uncharacterized membrane protein YagU involved in acid resistance|nr:hypothetical protein [Reyranella sp.]
MPVEALAIFVLLIVGTIAGLVVLILKKPGEMPLPMREPAINDSRISSQWAGGLGGGGPSS